MLCNMRFNENNVLDPGIHLMSWEVFFGEFSFSPKRKELLEGLKKVVDILTEAGCTDIYIDGSFAANVLEPNDWDACFDCAANKILEVFGVIPLDNTRLQKEMYGGELYPASTEADPYGTKFIDFFQQISGTPYKKGIIRIKLN